MRDLRDAGRNGHAPNALSSAVRARSEGRGDDRGGRDQDVTGGINPVGRRRPHKPHRPSGIQAATDGESDVSRTCLQALPAITPLVEPLDLRRG